MDYNNNESQDSNNIPQGNDPYRDNNMPNNNSYDNMPNTNSYGDAPTNANNGQYGYDQSQNSQYNNQYNGQNQYQNQNPYNNPYNNNMYYEEKKPSNGTAIASLILGILSILLSCCYGFGIVLAIPSIILAFVSRKSNNGKLSGMAIGGLVCSIFGILFAILTIVAMVGVFTSPDFANILKQIENGTYEY